jgi:hypothetical protein
MIGLDLNSKLLCETIKEVKKIQKSVGKVQVQTTTTTTTTT